MLFPSTVSYLFPVPSFWFANLIFIFLGVVPTIIVWRSASRTIWKVWGELAKLYIVISITFGMFVSPVALIGMNFNHRLTPEFYENTANLSWEASSFFKKHTGLDIPEGAKLVHVAYKRSPVMDYEANHHVILDASGMDLQKWISTAKPFGSNLQKIRPRRDLEWNADGLKCEERSNKEPKAENIIPICRIFGREVWQVEKRLRLDWMVTLTVLEEEKLIWLLEANW